MQELNYAKIYNHTVARLNCSKGDCDDKLETLIKARENNDGQYEINALEGAKEYYNDAAGELIKLINDLETKKIAIVDKSIIEGFLTKRKEYDETLEALLGAIKSKREDYKEENEKFTEAKRTYQEEIEKLIKAIQESCTSKQKSFNEKKLAYEEQAKVLTDVAGKFGKEKDAEVYNQAKELLELKTVNLGKSFENRETKLKELKVAKGRLEEARRNLIEATTLLKLAELALSEAENDKKYKDLLKELDKLTLPPGEINDGDFNTDQKSLRDAIKTTLNYYSVADTWHKQYKSWFNKFEGLQLANNEIPHNITSIFTKLDNDPLVNGILSKATSRENLDDKQKEVLANKLAYLFKDKTKADEFRGYLEKINDNEAFKLIYDQLKDGISVTEQPKIINGRKVMDVFSKNNNCLIYSLIATNNQGLLTEVGIVESKSQAN